MKYRVTLRIDRFVEVDAEDGTVAISKVINSIGFGDKAHEISQYLVKEVEDSEKET